jgi:biotin-(acetyl-CoA carboxylase) ligase
MLDDRKVAGVLAETTWDGRELQAIVGVGVNVTADIADLASLPDATSVGLASGRTVDRGDLLLMFIRQLDAWLMHSVDELHAAWQARLWRRGQRLRLLDLGFEREVTILGTASDGSLRVLLNDGTEHWTTTGELLA